VSSTTSTGPFAALRKSATATDHVVYTRDFIIAATEDASDVSAVTNRLMKNQEDIGDGISKFYGRPAGSPLTSLPKQHIQIAANLVKRLSRKMSQPNSRLISSGIKMRNR